MRQRARRDRALGARRLLTDEELEKLPAMADAMTAIAGNNLPGARQ